MTPKEGHTVPSKNAVSFEVHARHEVVFICFAPCGHLVMEDYKLSPFTMKFMLPIGNEIIN